MLCIIVPNQRTVSPEFVPDGYLCRHSCPVHSPSLCVQGKLSFSTVLTRNDGTTDKSKNVSDAVSRNNSFLMPWENSVPDGSQCIVNNRKFKMRRRESKKAIAWQGKTTTLHMHHAFCTFLCHHCTTTMWKCLISGFVKDVNKQWQNFLSLYELGYGWQKISSRRS